MPARKAGAPVPMAYIKPGTSGTFERVEHLERSEADAALARLDALARVMDSLIALPGTRIRLGADAVIGLVPVAGDLLAGGISLYLIWEAKRLGASKLVLWRMVANTLLDTAIGAVPIAGDIFDVAFRANKKNVRLLQRHLQGRRRAPQTPAGEAMVIKADWPRVS